MTYSEDVNRAASYGTMDYLNARIKALEKRVEFLEAQNEINVEFLEAKNEINNKNK